MTPRIVPGTGRDVGLLARVVARASGRVSGTTPPNLFLVLGRHRRLFLGWLHFAGRLMPGGSLPRADTELVILRVAHLAGCEYELTQHERLARRAGLDAAAVARTADGPEADGWTGRQRALLRAVDELHRDRDVSDATWSELRKHLDDRRMIELVMLAGHYEMLATTINTLRIPVDEPRPR